MTDEDAPLMRNGETWTQRDGKWTRIAPALTAEEWATATSFATREDGVCYLYNGKFGVGVDTYFLSVNPAHAIALANAALPDDDPRKITRENTEHIRGLAVHFMGIPEYHSDADRLSRIADALESYLPPE